VPSSAGLVDLQCGAMFTVGRSVGRLGELRFSHAFAIGDMATFRTRLAEVFRKVPGRLVLATDLRYAEHVDATVEHQLVEMMRTANPRIERNAFLVAKKGPVGMQMLRMALDADSRSRRVFQEPRELEAWLAESLTADERARLHTFLDEK
jgi:hypothetical protein